MLDLMSRLAVFNHPDWNSGGYLVQSDPFIIDTMVALIDQAPTGAQVRISISGWDVYDSGLDTDPILRALTAAVARGCDLKIILPSLWTARPDDPEYKIQWFQMNTAWKVIDVIKEVFRGNARHWPGAQELCLNINHNKFLLFSNLDAGGGATTKWVVANATCNWRYRDRDRANDMLIVAEDRPFYLAFLRYWQTMWMAANREACIAKFRHLYDDVPGGLRAHFMPLPDGSSDPVLDLLNSVVLGPNSHVRVVMATWGYGGRGRAIADKLLALADAGVDVRIVAHHEMQVSNEQKPWTLCTVNPVAATEPVGYCETSQAVWEKIAGHGQIRWAKSSSHSKYILVDAPLVGEGPEPLKIVLCGPLNFGNPITYSDCAMAENVVVLRDDLEIYQRYLDNFAWVCSEAWYKSTRDPCAT